MTTIRLPNLDGFKCVAITACGELETNDSALIGRLKKQSSLYGRYRVEGHAGYIHVSFGGPESGKHFHIDLASNEWRDQFNFPPVSKNSPIATIQKIMSQVVDHKIATRLKGTFRTPSSKLPNVVRSAQTTAKNGDAELKNIAGLLVVENSPVHMISWFADPDDDFATFTLIAEITATIDDSYLTDCLKLLTHEFNRLIAKG